MYKWYKCKARDMSIHKPKGFILTFRIGGESELQVRELLVSKGMKDIEYIKEDKDFPNNL